MKRLVPRKRSSLTHSFLPFPPRLGPNLMLREGRGVGALTVEEGQSWRPCAGGWGEETMGDNVGQGEGSTWEASSGGGAKSLRATAKPPQLPLWPLASPPVGSTLHPHHLSPTCPLLQAHGLP